MKIKYEKHPDGLYKVSYIQKNKVKIYDNKEIESHIFFNLENNFPLFIKDELIPEMKSIKTKFVHFGLSESILYKIKLYLKKLEEEFLERKESK